MSVLKNKGIKILLAATGINFVAGLLYIWSVISKSLVSELNWTSKEASLPYTIATVSFVISMIFLGKILDTKGPKISATIGSILLGLGLILSGLTVNPIIMVLTFGVLAGAGMGVLNVSTVSPTVRWFSPRKKGLITGVVVAGVGLSSVFYSPLSNYMIEKLGISKTFVYIGILALIVSGILSQVLENPPSGYTIKEPSNYISKSSDNVDLTWRDMLKSLDFLKLWAMLAFSSSAGLMIIGHISNIAFIQINWEGGFLLVILLAIFNTLGRLLGGSISDKIGRINLMRTIFIIQGVNMFLFARYSNIPLLAIGVGLAGLCYGAAFSVFPAAISDLFGTKNFGMNYGLMFTGWGLGGIIGPMTGAYIFDSTNNYNTAYLSAFVLLAISLSLTFTIKSTVFSIKKAELPSRL